MLTGADRGVLPWRWLRRCAENGAEGGIEFCLWLAGFIESDTGT